MIADADADAAGAQVLIALSPLANPLGCPADLAMISAHVWTCWQQAPGSRQIKASKDDKQEDAR